MTLPQLIRDQAGDSQSCSQLHSNNSLLAGLLSSWHDKKALGIQSSWETGNHSCSVLSKPVTGDSKWQASSDSCLRGQKQTKLSKKTNRDNAHISTQRHYSCHYRQGFIVPAEMSVKEFTLVLNSSNPGRMGPVSQGWGFATENLAQTSSVFPDLALWINHCLSLYTFTSGTNMIYIINK